jgi:hypothetical protein
MVLDKEMRHTQPRTHEDLTVIYYTSSILDASNAFFADNVRKVLRCAIADTPVISVSQIPLSFGDNVCVGNIGQSNKNLYTQVLLGVQSAKTKYVAMAEDDVLYIPDHFIERPREDSILLYNINRWGIFTWANPMLFSWRRRITLSTLICTRELLLRSLSERLDKYPEYDCEYCGEPGRYEEKLGLTPIEHAEFMSAEPVLMFSHPYSLSYIKNGARKAHGTIRAIELIPWGTPEETMRYYNE